MASSSEFPTWVAENRAAIAVSPAASVAVSAAALPPPGAGWRAAAWPGRR
jgi:hypothetical protein